MRSTLLSSGATGTETQLPESKSMISFSLNFAMNSDWHVGTGTGRPGNIDSLVQRDSDDLPFLPAKTVTGILRDAAEQLAYGLDRDDSGNFSGEWTRLVEILFGNQPTLPGAPLDKQPHAALLKIGSARYSKALRDCIRRNMDTAANNIEAQRLQAQLRNASTIIKPGVKIDEATGQAKTDFLRFEEMGRKGAKLEARCHLKLDELKDALREPAIALLLGSTRLIERVGGKRRRGSGRCSVEAVGLFLDSPDDVVTWLEKSSSSLKVSANGSDIFEPSTNDLILFEKAVQNDDWYAVPLVLKLNAPLAVTARTLGNVSETLDFLPGTYLLPHVTRALQGTLPNCREAIVRGDIQVLPGMLEVNGSRGLPVPLALFHEKTGGGFDKRNTVYNRFCEAAGTKQLKGYREGYIGAYQTGQLPTYKKVPKSLGTHNTVKDDVQRPTEEVGGVYSLEAIAAGVTLRSELRVRGDIKAQLDKKTVDWWRALTCEEAALGSSNKDDYGTVEIRAEEVLRLSPTPHPPSQKLTVWLLSDILLRDSLLRATTLAKSLGEELSQEVNVQLKEHLPPKQKDANGDERSGLLSSLMRVRRVESWQVGWGLPRPSLLAIQAGSCVTFEIVTGELDPETLQRIEKVGIGDRRAEGYGQVRFNDPLLTGPVSQWRTPDKPQGGSDNDRPRKGTRDNDNKLTVEEEVVANGFEESVWRDVLRHSLLTVAADAKKRKEILGLTESAGNSRPPFSQLGSLRNVLAGLRSPTDKDAVMAWIAHLKDTPNRRDKWNGSLAKVEKLIDDPEQVWSHIKWDEEVKLTLTGNVSRLKTSLWGEAVRGLVDACIRAHRRDLE